MEAVENYAQCDMITDILLIVQITTIFPFLIAKITN
ncbi:hypothetical protein BH18THE2_BH18THE2_16350 [soil metagenome]